MEYFPTKADCQEAIELGCECAGVKLLRMHIRLDGYLSSFDIRDENDQKRTFIVNFTGRTTDVHEFTGSWGVK